MSKKTIRVHNTIKEVLDESLIYEMVTANLNDHFNEFNCDEYKVVIKEHPKKHSIDNEAHVHIYHKQEGWEIRMSMEGEYICYVKLGKRMETDKFSDVEKVFRKWLIRKSVYYPEITNYVHIQRMWNENNTDKQIKVKPTLKQV